MAPVSSGVANVRAMNNAANQVRQSIRHVRDGLRAKRKESLRREILDALTRDPALPAAVYLFGSWATDRFDGESDTDLLVIASDCAVSAEAEQRLMNLADDVVSMAEPDWIRQRELSHPFVSRVAKERVLLVDTRDGRDD